MEGGEEMIKKIARIIGIFMFFVSIYFIIIACNNPQMSFPWSNTITDIIYILWFVMMILFIIAPFEKKHEISSSIFAVLPLTIMHYFYWNWLVNELRNNTLRLGWFLLVPVVITVLYCMYEKLIVYSVISSNTCFRDRIVPAVYWIVESLIAAFFSYIIIHDYEMKYSYGLTNGWKMRSCLFASIIEIVFFLFCRVLLYRNKKN